MPQLVYAKAPLVGVFTSKTHLLDARKQADKLALRYGFQVASTPALIEAMVEHPEIYNVVRLGSTCSLTLECYGLRKGTPYYEVWHSVGSLVTTQGLEAALSKMRGDLDPILLRIPVTEWREVGGGEYDPGVPRLSLSDLKRGRAPSGGPYVIFVRPKKDKSNIEKAALLGYDEFMTDDRTLMIAGSLENREELAKMIFRNKGKKGFDKIATRGAMYGLTKTIHSSRCNSISACLVILGKKASGFNEIYDRRVRFLACASTSHRDATLNPYVYIPSD